MTAERTRGETFGDFVRQRTIALGLFKDWEVSNSFQTEEGRFNIYSGFVPSLRDGRRSIHIVVGQKQEGDKSTWYFGTFRCPDWQDMTAEENERASQRELDFLKDKYRVPGGQLENLIREAVYFLP